jgi:uncharacterized protein YuzE
MKHRYLEVTFRRGKPLAAYLYLPRNAGAKAARTVDAGHGLRVDYDDNGQAIGVEITAPSAVGLDQINSVLSGLGQTALLAEEWAPARAA